MWKSNQVFPEWLREKALAFSSLNCKATWKQMGSFTAQEKEQAKCPVRLICVKIFSLKHKVLKKSVIYTKTWPSSLEQRQRVEKGNRSCPPCHTGVPSSTSLFSSGKAPNSPVGPTSMDRNQQTRSTNVLL